MFRVTRPESISSHLEQHCYKLLNVHHNCDFYKSNILNNIDNIK